jgi:hypothetical protein
MTEIALSPRIEKGWRRPDAAPAGDQAGNRPNHLFRDRVRRLHGLGPRPVGELLAEIMGRYPRTRAFVERRVEGYADLDPALVAHFGGRDWLEPAAVVRLVAGGRP